MKTSYFIRRLQLAGVVFFITFNQAFAEATATINSTPSPAEPLALRKIMQDMDKNMQTIVDAISREDWKRVEKTAPQIADHPQPPLSEKIRILAFVGSDVSQFKESDGKTNAAARVLEESAAREDGYAVIADFASLQNTCLMCHQRFQKSFQEHFYGKQ